jgi:hypothetical protein
MVRVSAETQAAQATPRSLALLGMTMFVLRLNSAAANVCSA